MAENKSKISWIIDIVIVLLLLAAIFKPVKYSDIKDMPEDKGQYNYCVQWSGFLDRDTLVFNCYNFVQKQVMCDFRVEENDTLVFYSYIDKEKVLSKHYCTKYIKAIDVPEREWEIPEQKNISVDKLPQYNSTLINDSIENSTCSSGICDSDGGAL